VQPDQAKSGQQDQDPARAYLFGQFRLDLSRQVLFRENNPLTLRPKSFDVLHHLLKNAGRVVSRNELFDAVWPDLVVTDDSLTQCLIEIRKALGEENRDLIRTIRGRGYLFNSEVTIEKTGGEAVILQSSDVRDRSRPPSRWTLVALLVLAGAVALTWWRTDMQEPANGITVTQWQPEPASIAVLPFVDMSEGGDHQYLAEGVAEEILNLLAQSSGLTVIARTSSFSFKDSTADISTIARQLNVAHILEGSVRQSGDRIRVTTQLIDGKTGSHIWSQTFDERLLDVFELQDRIALAVAEVLKVELIQDGQIGKPMEVHTPDPLAWEHYLRGQLYYSRRGEGDVLRAQRSFEEALAIDPEFADAWVALSGAYRLRLKSQSIPDAERLVAENASALIFDPLERALKINPNHAEALWRYSGLFWRTDPDKAFELLTRAAELGHNDTMIQGMMGGYLVERGQPELAIPFFQRAATLDPVNSSGLGISLYFAGYLDEADRIITRELELNPTGAHEQRALLAWIRITQAEYTSAAEMAQTLQNGADRDMTLAILNHLRGQTDAANQAESRLLALPDDESAASLTQVYAMSGDKDEAFRWLEIATDSIANSPFGYRARNQVTELQFSPFLISLHEDARWQAWWSVAENMFLNEKDQRLIAFLKSHLERHPDLYGSPPAVTAPE